MLNKSKSEEVYAETLIADGIINKANDGIVILGTGKLDKKLTVKRIESMTSRNGKIYIQTKGDKPNTLSDYLITKEDIIGLYQFKIPYAGYPSAIIYKLLGRV